MSNRVVVRDAAGKEVGNAEIVNDAAARYVPLKSLEWAKEAAMQYVVVPTAVIVFGLGLLDKASPDWLLKVFFSASSIFLLLSSISGGSLYLWIHGYVNRRELLAGGSLTKEETENYQKVVAAGKTMIPRLQRRALRLFIIGMVLFIGIPLIKLWRPSPEEPTIKAATISLPDDDKSGMILTAPNGNSWIISRGVGGNLVSMPLEIPMHRTVFWLPATDPLAPFEKGAR